MPKQMTEPTPMSQDLVTFTHAMLREIYEQPQALAATIEQYVPGGLSTAETFQPVVDALGGRERRAERHFVIARQLDVARHRENLGAAVIRLA